MNNELDLQIKLREKNERSNLGSSINDKDIRKSLNASVEANTNDIVPASKMLKELISQRSKK